MRKLLLIPLTVLFISAHAQVENALSFDGVSSYVEVNDNIALDLSDAFSIETWIYPTGTGSDPVMGGVIINKESSYEIARFADGTIQFAFNPTGSGAGWTWVNTGIVAPLNQWSHIALVKNGTSVTVYLNGANPYTTGSQPATLTGNSEVLRIAFRGNGTSQYFDGLIDEMRIWNTARTQSEIKANMINRNLENDASGLVAYYRMNEVTGTVLSNSCINTSGIDGTLVNSPAWTPSPIVFAGNAINFDGVDDFIVVPHVVSSDFTVEYWMKTTSLGSGGAGSQWYGGNGIVDAEVPGGANDWGTSLTGSKLAFGVGNPDVTIHSTSDVNTGSWVHVAASWKQSTGEMKLYINGVPEASATGSVLLRSAPTRITFGELQTNISRYNGTLDEVRIWNEVRTQAQIQASMNEEIDPSTEAGLTSYYTFNEGATAGTNTGLIVLPDQKGDNNGTLNNFTLTGSSSNYTAQNSNLLILPLEWLSFTAQRKEDGVLLNWSTANEQNTQDFVIQHSGDGAKWNNIALVRAAGNSDREVHYSYLHSTPVNGTNYYRIMQEDLDGRRSYSDVRPVGFTINDHSFIVLHNPIINGILQIKVNRPATLFLYNNGGKLLFHKFVGGGTETVNLSSYAKGVYFLKINDRTERIVVQ